MSLRVPVVVALALLATTAPMASIAQAQSADEKAVMAVVNHLFDGMRNRDTALMRSTLVSTAVLERADTGGLGKPFPMSQFIDRVGQGTGPGGNEQIKDPKIHIDGPLATVWAPYNFMAGGHTDINHCGTDAFLLRKAADGWKIFHISDTSHTTGCTPFK
jgi:hypothetical protein